MLPSFRRCGNEADEATDAARAHPLQWDLRGIVCLLCSILCGESCIGYVIGTRPYARAPAPVPAEVQYEITVRLDPVARKIEGRSVITANTPEELTLMLGRRFEVMHARVDG